MPGAPRNEVLREALIDPVIRTRPVRSVACRMAIQAPGTTPTSGRQTRKRGHRVNAPFPVERNILICTARTSLSENCEECLRRGLQSPATDWTNIVRKALEHGTVGLLCHHLLAAPFLPPALENAAAEFLIHSRKNSLSVVQELLAVLNTLEAAKVKAIPYKGPALAEAVYGDVSFRSFRDLDLLIRESDLPATIKALKQIGYSDRSSDLRE